jgi:hypothetical protein
LASLSDILSALQNGVIAINSLTAATRAAATGVAPSTTAALLPAASAYPGALYMVTDANATTRLSTVAGGGANIVLVYSNGTNWIIS